MRKSWPRYFMDIAVQVSTRATCDRRHVGAVIVSKDKHILATGYNGSIKGAPHCDDVGHLMEDNHCIRTVHAEANAIAQAAKNGARLADSAIYCTALPCWACFKLICNTGIKSIIYYEAYRASEHLESVQTYAKHAGVSLYYLSEEDTLVAPKVIL